MKHGMLNPKQFDTEEELPAFLIPVENLCIGDYNTGPIEIPVSYGSDWKPLFQLGSFVTFEQAIECMFAPDSLATLTLKNSKEIIQLLKSRMHIDAKEESVTFDVRLPIVPLVLRNSNTRGVSETLCMGLGPCG